MRKFLFLILLCFFGSNETALSQSPLLPMEQLQKTKLYKSIDEALLEPNNVYRLNLSNTGISQLPTEMSTLTKLQSLNISNNNITELPSEINNLKNLQFLNLEGTNIVNLPDLSQFKNLISLDLDNISTLNGANALNKIFNVKSLRELSMSSVFIMAVPTEIKKLKNLLKLNLSRCGLTEFSKGICMLKNLIYLDLSFNEISSIPSDIGKMKKLEEFYIGGNRITSIPEEIEELDESLQVLGLATAESDSGEFVGNPITKDEMMKIEKLLPNTKVIFVWN